MILYLLLIQCMMGYLIFTADSLAKKKQPVCYEIYSTEIKKHPKQEWIFKK